MNVSKLIITAKSTLQLKYGSNFNKIDKLLTSLKTADAKRKISSQIVYVDDKTSCKSAGINAVKRVNAQECKRAVDALYKKHTPDYMVLVGSQDIFPFQELNNPADDDGDMRVPSDLPYACDAPYSKQVQGFTGPTRVVGRIPDVPGSSDISYLTAVINHIIKAKPQKDDLFRNYFAISAFVWRQSTEQSLQATFGEHSSLFLSPGHNNNYSKTELKKLSHFYNCHGAEKDFSFYGQKGDNYPIAISTSQLNGKISTGTIVAAECCYGAELVNPALLPDKVLSIANNYLLQNAVAFVGSSNIAYGPADGQGLADLITQYFIKNVIDGSSTGSALLQARQEFLKEVGPDLDPYELKTLAQFYLLGDPSVLSVIDETQKKIVSKNTVQNNRLRLIKTGAELQKNLAPSRRKTQVSVSPNQRKINSLLKETGFSNHDIKGIYESKSSLSPKSIFAKKLGSGPIRFRTFVKRQPVQKKTGIAHIKVLVIKENKQQLLGWRLYERK